MKINNILHEWMLYKKYYIYVTSKLRFFFFNNVSFEIRLTKQNTSQRQMLTMKIAQNRQCSTVIRSTGRPSLLQINLCNSASSVKICHCYNSSFSRHGTCMKLFSNLQIICPIINTHPFSRCTTCYTASKFLHASSSISAIKVCRWVNASKRMWINCRCISFQKWR